MLMWCLWQAPPAPTWTNPPFAATWPSTTAQTPPKLGWRSTPCCKTWAWATAMNSPWPASCCLAATRCAGGPRSPSKPWRFMAPALPTPTTKTAKTSTAHCPPNTPTRWPSSNATCAACKAARASTRPAFWKCQKSPCKSCWSMRWCTATTSPAPPSAFWCFATASKSSAPAPCPTA